MLHKRDRRLYGCNVGKAGVFFTFVASIGNCVIGQQLDLLWDDLHLMAQKFLANGFHFPAAFSADQLFLRLSSCRRTAFQSFHG